MIMTVPELREVDPEVTGLLTPDTGSTVGRVEAPLTADVTGAMDAETPETPDTGEILAVSPETVEAVDPGEAGVPGLPGVPGVPEVSAVPWLPDEPDTGDETDPLTGKKRSLLVSCRYVNVFVSNING